MMGFRMFQRGTAVAPIPEAVRVVVERGGEVPIAALPISWQRVRRDFAAVCRDCEWKTVTGVAEPAWMTVMEAFGQTCEACADKMENGDLDTCRNCPAPDALSRLIRSAKTGR